MSTVAYTCPGCGAPLEYNAETGKLGCEACGSSYDLDAIEVMPAEGSKESIHFERPQETFDGGEDGIQAYICNSCGAELMTEGTTTATECPYCGSPTVLPDRIEGSVKPEFVIPFTVTKEQAQKQFEEYFKGKKLMPNVFLNGRNRITDMRKLYVPYWLFDCKADGDVVYNATKKHRTRQGDWEIEHTDHYIVRRAGSMDFENIPVDGSEKLDNKITESLEPYDLSAAVPFQPAVLAGAMADHADVDAEACEERAVERVKRSLSDAFRNTIHGYSTVSERSSNIATENGKVRPVLMPVWLITTEKEGKTYTFAINGQTGKLTCDVPADTKKSILWCGGIFAGVFGIAALILAMLDSISGGSMLIGAVVALIAMLIGFAILKGQLQQAVSQHSAAEYVKEGSFDLRVNYDRFLYRTTSRRKIETAKK